MTNKKIVIPKTDVVEEGKVFSFKTPLSVFIEITGTNISFSFSSSGISRGTDTSYFPVSRRRTMPWPTTLIYIVIKLKYVYNYLSLSTILY